MLTRTLLLLSLALSSPAFAQTTSYGLPAAGGGATTQQVQAATAAATTAQTTAAAALTAATNAMPRVTKLADLYAGATAYDQILACEDAVLAANPLGGTCDASGLYPPTPYTTFVLPPTAPTLAVPPQPLSNGGTVTVTLADNLTFQCTWNDPVGQETHRCLWTREGGKVRTKSDAAGLWTTTFQIGQGMATNFVGLCQMEDNPNTNNYMEWSGFQCSDQDLTNGGTTVHTYSSGYYASIHNGADHLTIDNVLFSESSNHAGAFIEACCGAKVTNSTFAGSINLPGYVYTLGGTSLTVGPNTSQLLLENDVVSNPAVGYNALHITAGATVTIHNLYGEGNGGSPRNSGGNSTVFPEAHILIDQYAHPTFNGLMVRGLCDSLFNSSCDGNYEVIENHSSMTILTGLTASGGFQTGFDDRTFPTRHNWAVEGGSGSENFGVILSYLGGRVTHIDGTESGPYDVPPTGACSSQYGSNARANNGVAFRCDLATQTWTTN